MAEVAAGDLHADRRQDRRLRVRVRPPDGDPLHPDHFSQVFQRLIARMDLPKIRLHDLRHTHATLLLNSGVPIKVVSERLGHGSVAFTMQICQHVLPGMQADAAVTFGEIVFRSDLYFSGGR